MITSSFYGGPCMDGRVSPEPVSTLRSRATTNYLASFHSDDFCCIKTGITSPDQPYVTSDVSGGNGPSYLGAFRPSSSLPGFTFSDPSDNSRAPVSGNGANCSLKFPPGLWSEAGSALVNAQSLAQCNFLDLSESFSSLSAGPSSQLAAPEFSLSSLPPSGSGTSVQSEALSHQYFLSNLKFLGTLGRGGYGKVLLAESSRSGNHSSRVAVKVLTKRWMSIDDVREVKTEVQILEALSRRNGPGSAFLQRIHAAFQTKEHVFIVMERLCTTLSDIAIQRQFSLRPQGSSATLGPRTLPNSVSLPATFPSTLPYSDALGSLRLLSAELILGLLFLHGQGIVHQDVKPANVLVSADGHAVITDFGSARLRPLSAPSRTTYAECFDDAPDFSSNSAWEDAPPRATAYFGPIILSANDQVSFTRRYAAPELLYAPVWMSGRNVLVYDERVDYYSLGVMLHELALGDPYDSCNSQDRWERASDGPSRSTTLSVDAAFLSFIDGLLAYDADQRLHGLSVKTHDFLAPFGEAWDDIAALRYPPFVDVFWPDPDPDTRLDLRSYDDEGSPSSSEKGCVANTWSAELADIPYDVGHPPSPSVQQQPQPISSETTVEGIPQPTTLPSQECLSFLPSIPTLDSSILDKFPIIQLKSFQLPHVQLAVPKRKATPLRRRQVIYDLRKAFQFTYTVEHPTRSTCVAGRPTSPCGSAVAICEKQLGTCTPLRRRESGERRMTMSASWSFEDEITIALLSTMDSRNGPAGLHASKTGRSVASGGTTHAARRGGAPATVGLPQLDIDSTFRARGRAILRRLKALMPYY